MHDIRPFIPELFTNPGSLLYIGARADAHSWLDELHEAGNRITVLEVWPDNVAGLIGYPAIHDLVQGDARDIVSIFKTSFDYIFWWHGPEHIGENAIPFMLHVLETKCNRLIALACPYGLYPQGAHKGNPYEEHKTTLYPEFFIGLGYQVKIDGRPAQAGSEIVAWKVIQ